MDSYILYGIARPAWAGARKTRSVLVFLYGVGLLNVQSTAFPSVASLPTS